MTTILGFCADCHLGNHKLMGGETNLTMNVRCLQTIDAFQRAIKVAERAGVTHLIVVGDLLDTMKPTPQMLAKIGSVISETEIEIICLVGNHEHGSSAAGDNSLAPLRYAGVKIVERPEVIQLDGVTLLCLPCVPKGVKTDFKKEVADLVQLKESSGDLCVICFHRGVSDANTPHYLQGARGAVHVDEVLEVLEEHGISAAFAGDWHHQRIWRDKVFQLGALSPTGFDNPGLTGYAGLATYVPSEDRTYMTTISGPRFLPLRLSADMSVVQWAKDAGNQVYLRLTCRPDELTRAEDLLADMRQKGLICDGMTIPDKEAQQDVARTVAARVRKAESLQEAIVGAVAAQDLAENVAKEEVVRRLSQYLSC